MKSYTTLLPEMLADGIQVMLYNGDCDFITNWLGDKQWALKMEWDHREDFNAAQDENVILNDVVVGRLRSSSGLSFFQVFQAGHSVAMDQPDVILNMVNEFTKGMVLNGLVFNDAFRFQIWIVHAFIACLCFFLNFQ